MDIHFPCRLMDSLGSFFKPERVLAQAVTNSEKINVVYALLFCKNLLPSLVTDEKDDIEAKRILDQGTALFHERRFTDALHKYTRALAKAEVTSNLRALAHANRAAVLIHIGLYEECATECDRALDSGYPESKRPKLLERKERATRKIPQQANTKYHGEIPSIPENKRNATIPCASDHIAIGSDEIHGKYVVATKDIQPGEVLIVEQPLVGILEERDVTTFCDHCLELCYNPIPCDKCTSVLYCSNECKNQAHEMYHRYECPITLTLLDSGFSRMRLLPLRIMLQEFHDLFKEAKPDLGASAQSSSLNRMLELLQMRNHLDDLRIEELFTICSYVCFIYHSVKEYTDFLTETDQHIMFKDVLLSLYSISVTNAITLSSTQLIETRTATGIYSVSSLLNHSCDPNVFLFHYGGTVVLRAVKPISKNQQCYMSYGCRYEDTRKAIRQQMLKTHYHFDCKCKACEQDWPMMRELRMDDILDAEIFMRSLSETDPRAVDNLIQEIKRHMHRRQVIEPSNASTHLVISLITCYNKFTNNKKI